MVYHTCAVPGCEDKISTRHRFPNPEKDKHHYDSWILLIANPKLRDMDPQHVYYSYRVCHKHFSPEDKSTNIYLKKTTLPSLNLPSSVLVDKPPLNPVAIATSSRISAIECSSEQVEIHTEVRQYQPTSTDQLCCTPTRELPESLLHSLGVTRSAELTPKAKALYKKAKHYIVFASVYKIRNKSFRRRLKCARKMFSNSKCGLRTEAVNFCMQQLLRRATKPKGRRYSLEEKLMSLT